MACAARADALERWLQAFCYRPSSYETGEGLLGGVPIGVKDIIATADMPTTNGSVYYQHHVPEADAWIVKKIKQYGGTVFGKTVTTEFAWRHAGPTVNAWNRLHTPGGSSSGSAAAVAAGLVPLAFGSQTLGSIIRPAAFNGVVGFKPSFGSMSLEGVHPLAASLDHLGFFTRNVADAAAAYALFAAQTPDVLGSEAAWQAHFPAAAPPTFAVIRTEAWGKADREQQADFDAALAKLRQAGAILHEVSLPVDSDAIFAATLSILQYEAARIHQSLIANHPEKASDILHQLVANGLAVTDAEYNAAKMLQKQLKADFEALVAPYDAVLTLPALGAAPLGLAFTGDSTFCAAWSLMGVPALSIPSGWSGSKLPLGLQICGPFGSDQKLLRTAAWAEAQLAWAPGIIS
ncbi:MAG: hypothetical protein B7Z71_04345 [Acidocella sp. 21-58-7]|nr:MAG: hypothetical protein B7Z71_04345 [Acidocella sp. 21-58-7]